MRRESRIPHKRYVIETHEIPDGVTGEMVEAKFCTYRVETEGSNHSKCSHPNVLLCSGKIELPWNKAQCKIKGQKKWRGKYVEHACNDQVFTDPCDSKTQKALMIAKGLDEEDGETDTWAPFDPASADVQRIPFTISEGRHRGGCRRGHRKGQLDEEHVWLDHRHGLRGSRHLHHFQGHGGHHHGPGGFLHRHHPHGGFGLAYLYQPRHAPVVEPPTDLGPVPGSYWETIHPTEHQADDHDEVKRDTLAENWNVPMEGWGRTDDPWDVVAETSQPPAHPLVNSGLYGATVLGTAAQMTDSEDTRSIASNSEMSAETAMTEGFGEVADCGVAAPLESDWQSVSGDDWETLSDGALSEVAIIDEL